MPQDELAMSLITLLVRLRDRRRMTQIAHDMADTVTRTLLDDVADLIRGMPTAEARGYIQAKARPVVEARVGIFLHDHPTFPTESRGAFVAAVREHAVSLVLAELAQRAAPPRVLRRAA